MPQNSVRPHSLKKLLAQLKLLQLKLWFVEVAQGSMYTMTLCHERPHECIQ